MAGMPAEAPARRRVNQAARPSNSASNSATVITLAAASPPAHGLRQPGQPQAGRQRAQQSAQAAPGGCGATRLRAARLAGLGAVGAAPRRHRGTLLAPHLRGLLAHGLAAAQALGLGRGTGQQRQPQRGKGQGAPQHAQAHVRLIST